MSKDKPDNVIPLIKEKRTRDIVRNEFNGTSSAQRLKERLESINEKMADLRETIRKQNEYLAKNEPKLSNQYAAERMKEEPIYQDKTETNTLDTAALEAEYRRKQDEMRKKREENNRSVTRSYQLTRPKRDK